MPPFPRLPLTTRRTLIIVMALALVAGAALAAWHWAFARHLEEQLVQARQRLHQGAQSLEQLIGRYRALPLVLALDPELRAALEGEIDPATRQRLNQRLERANRDTRASTLTLIDAHGIAVAASNWRETDSNVGNDYGFRPYVQQAFDHGQGRFYGVGITTGQPGYFLSEAIRNENDAILGVIVIKIGLNALEQDWLRGPDRVLVTDAHGVAFLASEDHLRYRLLRPLDETARQALAATRQYPPSLLHPLQLDITQTLDEDAALIQLAEANTPMRWLMVSLPLPEHDWHLHLMHRTDAAIPAAHQAAAVTALAGTLLLLVALFVRQRLHLGALRQRSREELEHLVQQHAKELRTARDGLIEAAEHADTGLSQALEHLPQGVVIIDAELRLVAWNSRYLELFRFPPGLIEIGRPIAEVFRYNASRGLLGPGPIEDAIQRRLAHLKNGTAHMHEREKDDGMVLEICGNPLPGGGFVTSYADITRYRQAARELRSLASALEARITERTQELDAARREAEQANRHKTRFVAAAVHDLLQPLNAARMFLSALSTRLPDAEARTISDHAEDALTAQDAILTSLLDISRLESGTQHTAIEDFALAPLLDTLAREFDLIAHERGLRLSVHSPHLNIRSDPALLRRIVQNLLSNAVRYTMRGRIVLGARRMGDAVRIEVHDTGPGIAPERQREIFEEFRRLDNDAGHGAGLGLAIVERIARLLDHPTGLSSTLGRGSVFWVCVPLARTAPPPSPIAPEPSTDTSLLSGCRVWCIDDDPLVCTATRTLLLRWGCVVGYAGGPVEALRTARPGQAPELLLLDFKMGELDGVEVSARLFDTWRARPQVILITAEQGEDIRALAAHHGWAYLPKPVRPPALRALMTQLRLRAASAINSVNPPHPAP